MTGSACGRMTQPALSLGIARGGLVKPAMPKTADLLEEIAALKAILAAAGARDRRKDKRIERLEKLVAAFRQAVFGRRSRRAIRTSSSWRWKIWKPPWR